MLLDNPSRFSTSASPSPAPIPLTSNDEATNTNDLFSDIFSSSPPRPTTNDITTSLASAHLQEQSDIPRIQSQHSNAGYREGISSSKALFVQEGFDEGYMLGAELGMRGGWCLGVLNGIVRALGGSVEKKEELERCRKLLGEARKELSVKGLYAPEYFGQDGIWRFDVGEKKVDGEEEELDFRKVAAAHPVVRRWVGVVEGLVEELGLDLARLEDAEGEAVD